MTERMDVIALAMLVTSLLCFAQAGLVGALVSGLVALVLFTVAGGRYIRRFEGSVHTSAPSDTP